MTPSVPPRLRKPAGIALAGVVLAAAWLVRGGPLWWVSIMALIVTAIRSIALYRAGGQDTDEGALAGSRLDERQTVISQRSRALACSLTVVAAFAGLVAAIAVSTPWWWPFLVILAVAGFGYLLGLSAYGVAEEVPADDDEGAGQRSPGQALG
jgi:hypothetical protein